MDTDVVNDITNIFNNTSALFVNISELCESIKKTHQDQSQHTPMVPLQVLMTALLLLVVMLVLKSKPVMSTIQLVTMWIYPVTNINGSIENSQIENNSEIQTAIDSGNDSESHLDSGGQKNSESSKGSKGSKGSGAFNTVMIIILTIAMPLLAKFVYRNHVITTSNYNDYGLCSSGNTNDNDHYNYDTCYYSNASGIYSNDTCLYRNDTCSCSNDTCLCSEKGLVNIKTMYRKLFDNIYAKFVNHSITFVHMYTEYSHLHSNDDDIIRKYVDDRCHENIGFYSKNNDLAIKYIYKNYIDLTRKYAYLSYRVFSIFKKYNDLYRKHKGLGHTAFDDDVKTILPCDYYVCSNGNSIHPYCIDNLPDNSYVFFLKAHVFHLLHADSSANQLITLTIQLKERVRRLSNLHDERMRSIEEIMLSLFIIMIVISFFRSEVDIAVCYMKSHIFEYILIGYSSKTTT